MSIQKQLRNAERNLMTDKMYSNSLGSFSDISELANKYMRDALSTISQDIRFILCKDEKFLDLDGVEAKSEFYPLDKNLSESDVGLTLLAIDCNVIPPRLKSVLERHIENIKIKVRSAQLKDPTSKLAIYFSPADSINHIGTEAMYGYAFLIGWEGNYRLETECSFVVLPYGE